MRFIFYSSVGCEVAERLRRIIEEHVPVNLMDMYQSIEELSQGLRLPPGAATIADLVAASHKDRQDILSLNDLIANFRTILIVPDSEKETISRGHRLVPRYMGFIGANLSDFAAVLHKTLELVQKQGN